MPELLKNRYNDESLRALALSINTVYPPFQVDDFVNGIMDETWDGLELKARMRQITINLGRYLPDDYEQALGVIDKIVAGYPEGFNDFTLMCFPDFVEVYGQEERHWNLSMAALERYTSSSSSEFAVRPFIINHEERMMRQMAAWASQGVGQLVFLIGGSFGLHPSIKAEARLRLSMSPMTFPHHLARVMVLEQIYRAYQINAGTKYHK